MRRRLMQSLAKLYKQQLVQLMLKFHHHPHHHRRRRQMAEMHQGGRMGSPGRKRAGLIHKDHELAIAVFMGLYKIGI